MTTTELIERLKKEPSDVHVYMKMESGLCELVQDVQFDDSLTDPGDESAESMGVILISDDDSAD
jgi:hypothetical protein